MTEHTGHGTPRSGGELQQWDSCTASRHGTALAYQVDRCRCPDARADQARYRKQLRWRHHRGHGPIVAAVGSVRRFHALQAIGWPRPEIMRRLGLSDSGTWLVYADGVNERTALAVKHLYDELADTPGPSRWTATYARNQGWLPPIWWDDDTIDDPAHDPQTSLFVGDIQLLENKEHLDAGCQKHSSVDPVSVDRACDLGQPLPPLNRAEKACAYNEMDRRRVPRNEIARRLRISGATARIFADAVGDRADDARMSEAVS